MKDEEILSAYDRQKHCWGMCASILMLAVLNFYQIVRNENLTRENAALHEQIRDCVDRDLELERTR